MIDDPSIDAVDRAGIPLGESGGSQMLIDNQVVTLRFVWCILITRQVF